MSPLQVRLDAVSDPVLEVSNLEIQFKARRRLGAILRRTRAEPIRAVDDVSFVVGRGELVALVGESGSGKTTTAQAILGIERPHSGSVRIHGRDISGFRRRDMRALRRSMQPVYQDPYES